MFEGVITALVTPFRRDLLDEDALRRLVDEQIAAGVDGLVPVGTTGESPTLTMQEHIHVIEVVIEAAARRVPVIAGTGSNSTHEAIELSLAAKRAGADGLLLVTPYYNRPGQEHMYRHFRAIMQTASLPTIVYNVPSRTAFSVVSNVAPALMSAMWDAAAAGDWTKARQLHYRLLPISEGLFVEANPIPVKAALAMMGRMTEEVRPPLYPLAEPYRAKLRAQLDELGLLEG
jgi:dihydrodipicolinate synthase/N-acetylneuraminate lyase